MLKPVDVLLYSTEDLCSSAAFNELVRNLTCRSRNSRTFYIIFTLFWYYLYLKKNWVFKIIKLHCFSYTTVLLFINYMDMILYSDAFKRVLCRLNINLKFQLVFISSFHHIQFSFYGAVQHHPILPLLFAVTVGSQELGRVARTFVQLALVTRDRSPPPSSSTRASPAATTRTICTGTATGAGFLLTLANANIFLVLLRHFVSVPIGRYVQIMRTRVYYLI